MLEHSPVIGIGSNVLVTGSNRGIGLGFVQVLVKAPGVKRVFAACRNPEQAKDLQELQKKFPGLELIKLDVQSDASIKQAFEHISKAVDDEGLNLLMNNSAILGKKGAAVEDVDRAVFLRHFDVNTVSVAVLNATFLPLLRKAAASGGLARIVNISSDLASVQTTTNCVPLPSGELNVIYGMTK
ncbi:Protein C30G12.2, partial [Aphelenchoides avenae]